MLLLQLIVAFTMELCKSNPILYTLNVACGFLCVGGHMATFSASAVNIFGLKNGGQIFSIIDSALPFASLASMFLVQQNVSSPYITYAGGTLSLINLILLYLFSDQPMQSKSDLNRSKYKIS